jgi:hypothetical protein
MSRAEPLRGEVTQHCGARGRRLVLSAEMPNGLATLLMLTLSAARGDPDVADRVAGEVPDEAGADASLACGRESMEDADLGYPGAVNTRLGQRTNQSADPQDV